MQEYKHVTLPLSIDVLQDLHAGDTVYLSGIIYTARDAAHKRMAVLFEQGADFPFAPDGAAIYYAGPCPAVPGMALGACGPTTSSRMDSYAPDFIRHGLRVMIGKGPRNAAVVQTIQEQQGIYFSAAGGAGALYANCVLESQILAFEDLGPEALRRLVVRNMPLIVAIDAHGGNIYQSGIDTWRREIRALEPCEYAMLPNSFAQNISGTLYGCFLGTLLASVMALSDTPCAQFAQIRCSAPIPSMYLHILYTDPLYLRADLHVPMVHYATQYARTQGARALRTLLPKEIRFLPPDCTIVECSGEIRCAQRIL